MENLKIYFADHQKISKIFLVHQYMPKIFHGPCKNPSAPTSSYLMHSPSLTCVSSISKPLCLLFEHSLGKECLPNKWKKANIVPIHEKSNKQFIKYCEPK